MKHWVGVINACQSLTELTIEKTSLSDHELEEIVSAIIHHTSLEKLFLQNNQLSSTAGVSLHALLCYAHNLRNFACIWNHLGAEGLNQIAKGLEHNRTVTRLSLEETGMNDDSAQTIAQSCVKNTVLEWLTLTNNPQLTDRGVQAFLDMVTINNTLNTLEVNCPLVSQEQRKAVSDWEVSRQRNPIVLFKEATHERDLAYIQPLISPEQQEIALLNARIKRLEQQLMQTGKVNKGKARKGSATTYPSFFQEPPKTIPSSPKRTFSWDCYRKDFRITAIKHTITIELVNLTQSKLLAKLKAALTRTIDPNIITRMECINNKLLIQAVSTNDRKIIERELSQLGLLKPPENRAENFSNKGKNLKRLSQS